MASQINDTCTSLFNSYFNPLTKKTSTVTCDSRHKKGVTWRRHRMETFSSLLALYEGNSPVTGGFSSQRPVARSFDAFLNKRLNKQSRRRWFGTPSPSYWRHCNVRNIIQCHGIVKVTPGHSQSENHWPSLVDTQERSPAKACKKSFFKYTKFK